MGEVAPGSFHGGGNMALDIQNHELVPDHEKMDEEEVQNLLEEYDIEKENLPKIKSDDSVMKSMDAEPGDVIRIIRESETAGKTEYYRIVVE
ncbi:MAG: DNA-directed RNA polymerase subunit H [Candidatus Nanohaloarchaeota archaeon QJJ-9]|nr:DNA-directed RNA polymerase subunit H [Candidatus Nanohaloarchaeota archaeon QJJ-9]